MVRHVHQRHEGRDEVERIVGKGQRPPVANFEIDAQRIGGLGFAGVPDKGRSNIDAAHSGSQLGQFAGVRALAATDVQPLQTRNRRQHGQKGGRVQRIPIDVIAGARKPRPGLGILFPKPRGIGCAHRLSSMVVDLQDHFAPWPQLNLRPTMAFTIQWSVAAVGPMPTPKLISQSGETFRSMAGKSCCCWLCRLAIEVMLP